ncbi:hypothetical protein TESG_01194 [Trichophyton tonsurans CBS 112818]|uniref:BING4 C-terminal domain-containing protein n=1 Tax=Trichophyton tonsurans (strain CBS 112818) TaxID=647933 RepID=F2RQQ4_TRIT1|nr:hypothetical protein TESG_01194 [Trichophyton tonsurans CBS 112818]
MAMEVAKAKKDSAKRSKADVAADREARKQFAEAQETYGRGKQVAVKSVRDKKLRSNLKSLETKYKNAILQAKDSELLLENEAGFIEAEGELERTYKVRQEEIKENVGIEVAKNGFELKLEDLGPYKADYTRNGRKLLLAGRKGHVATMDWREGKLGCELQLGETVRDARWLHNDQFFAVAQKKYVYIYDHSGVEIHCLNKHVEPTHLEFLPYHFLLASVGMSGFLKYTDTSTEPHNAILHVGHQNGTVSLWSPNSQTALVKALVHRGPVRSVAVDKQGRYMVSTGQDQKMAVWDIRMFKEVHSYYVHQPGSTVAISDRGLTGVGWGTQVSVWKGLFQAAREDQEKVKSPYMAWGGDGQRVEGLRWCPYEDVLGIAHDKGFSSMIVPGAGEPNFDAMEANPYETSKQRQEAEVKSLLTKLQPEMISLNPDFVGNLDLTSDKARREARDLDKKKEDIAEKLKNRGRGRNSALRKYLRKRGGKNIIDENRLKVEAMRREQNERLKEKRRREREALGPALEKFVKK